MGAFLTSPDPLPCPPSLLRPQTEPSPVPGNLWGACHWRNSTTPGLGVPGGRNGAPPSRHPRGLVHTFLKLILAGSPRAFREGCDRGTHAGWSQGPHSPAQASRPRASARTSAQQPVGTWAGTLGRCCCAPCHRQWWSLQVPQSPLGEIWKWAQLRSYKAPSTTD